MEKIDIRKLAESSGSISISVVRNPFERLVSAYQDKIVTGGNFLKMRSMMERYYGVVSFPNFVTLILRRAGRLCRTVKSCQLDRHWLPMVSRCCYCDLQYTAIARLESLSEELDYIGMMAGGVEFSHLQAHSSEWNITEAAVRYFSQVPKRDVEELQKLYQIDFELFQYSADLYLKLSK